MSENITLREFVKNYDAGLYSDSRSGQCDAGWYDWFCSDNSLSSRLKSMYPLVKAISESKKIDPDNTYVFFKNNCPMWVQRTYDDFRICDMVTGDVIWTISPAYPKDEGHDFFSVYGILNDFQDNCIDGTKEDFFKFFEISPVEFDKFESDEEDEEYELCPDCSNPVDECSCNDEDDEYDYSTQKNFD